MDEAGAGDALVLLHGVGASRGVWRRAMPRLARRRRVLAPDLPGFGGSDPAGAGFDLDAVADALAAGLADRAAAPFDLVGNSLGGAVAVVLAARRPDLVRAVIAGDSALYTDHLDPDAAISYLANLPIGFREAAIGMNDAVGFRHLLIHG